MIRINDSSSFKLAVRRLRTIAFLILSLLSCIVLELKFNCALNFYPQLTLLEHIQSSLTLVKLISLIVVGSIGFILLFGILIIVSTHGTCNTYITLLKFFELIPALIDIINLLFIYEYKRKYFNKENLSIATTEIKTTMHLPTRFVLTLTFALIRLIINFDVVFRKCDCKWKRKIIILLDLSLFILVNVSLLRYSTKNLFRIGRKIVLPILIYQLDDLFFNETFWIDLIKWNEHIKQQFNSTFLRLPINLIFNWFKNQEDNILLKIMHLMLVIRWIISSFIVYLFVFYIFKSIIIVGDENLFFLRHIYIFIKSHGFILMICIIILYLLLWDTLQNRNTLNQIGIVRFCIGFDLLPMIKLTKIFSQSQANSNTTIVENIQSSPILKQKKQQTCAVCYEDKDPIEFDDLFSTNCQHMNRSLCNSCVFRHVQQGFQITFTDDIYCPEANCNVKLDYSSVKNILFLYGDHKLVERYDRYVFHREVEQMDEFIWCSNVLCNVGQLNEGGARNNIVTCFNCRQKTCFAHKIKWHEGLTCEEYDKGIVDPNYESSRRWIVENSKKCPKCPYQIEKNDGCDHMTCIKCRHEFCWSCLADFQPIRTHGNQRHNSTCKHYAPYDEK